MRKSQKTLPLRGDAFCNTNPGRPERQTRLAHYRVATAPGDCQGSHADWPCQPVGIGHFGAPEAVIFSSRHQWKPVCKGPNKIYLVGNTADGTAVNVGTGARRQRGIWDAGLGQQLPGTLIPDQRSRRHPSSDTGLSCHKRLCSTARTERYGRLP